MLLRLQRKLPGSITVLFRKTLFCSNLISQLLVVFVQSNKPLLAMICHSADQSSARTYIHNAILQCHVPSRGPLSLVPCSFWGVQGVSVQGRGSLFRGLSVGRPPELERRAVRILLECFLVGDNF